MQTTERQHYRGVLCLHCKEGIAISQMVANMEADDSKCHVFNIRCSACGKERQYKIAEIRDLEGSPVRAPRLARHSPRLRPGADKSKAAANG